MIPRALAALLLLGAARRAAANVATESQYLIGSFPSLHWIQYMKLPDTNWRPLVITGLVVPKAMAVDESNMRLYIVDEPTLKIVWYTLQVLPDGKLITLGRQHVAVEQMAARGVEVDGTGNLYFSGKSSPPIPQPNPAYEQIYMQNSIAIATQDTMNSLVSLWSRDNTGSSADSKVFVPDAIALDSFSIFWGNREGGNAHSSVSKASKETPDLDPQLAVHALADNEDEVLAIELTTTNVFYSGKTGIHGVPKGKLSGSCGENECTLISDKLKEVTSMVWDGDGTMYCADGDAGGIYHFPSGSVGKHTPELMVKAPGIHGMTLFAMDAHSSAFFTRIPLLALSVTAFLAALQE